MQFFHIEPMRRNYGMWGKSFLGNGCLSFIIISQAVWRSLRSDAFRRQLDTAAFLTTEQLGKQRHQNQRDRRTHRFMQSQVLVVTPNMRECRSSSQESCTEKMGISSNVCLCGAKVEGLSPLQGQKRCFSHSISRRTADVWVNTDVRAEWIKFLLFE